MSTVYLKNLLILHTRLLEAALDIWGFLIVNFNILLVIV